MQSDQVTGWITCMHLFMRVYIVDMDYVDARTSNRSCIARMCLVRA